MFSVLSQSRDSDASHPITAEHFWSDCCRTFRHEILERSCHVDSEYALLSSAVNITGRLQGLLAVAIWLRDTRNKIWRSCGSTGDEELVRYPLVEPSSDETWRKLSCDTTRAWSAARSEMRTAATPLGDEHDPDGLLLIAVRNEDVGILDAVVESLASELSGAMRRVRQRQDDRKCARFAIAAIQASPIPIVGLRPDQECLQWSRAAEELFGWPESDVIGQKLKIISRSQQGTFWESFERCLSTQVSGEGRFLAQRWDGVEIPVSITMIPLINDWETVDQVVLMICDRTDVDETTRHLRLQLRVATVLSTSSSLDVMGKRVLSAIGDELRWSRGRWWRSNDAGPGWRKAIDWNASACGIRPASVPAKSSGDGDDTGLLEQARTAKRPVWSRHQSARSSRLVEGPVSHRLHDVGVPICVDGHVSEVLVFPAVEDASQDRRLNDTLTSISEQLSSAIARRQLEDALEEQAQVLRQANKMDSLGMLAGGIAHDFNNVLTVILGNVELMVQGLAEDAPARKYAAEIEAASMRASALTQRLLTFSRKRPGDPGLLQLNDKIRELEGMLQRVVGENIGLELSLVRDAHPVFMDPVEFEQVLLNLAGNARDAISGAGTLSISTKNGQLSLADVGAHPDVTPGDFLTITVADTGCGLNETTQSRIFEPFFTTKDIGKGTGLGLATVHGIVRRCRGLIAVSSEFGKGTQFVIHLPRAAVGIAPRPVDAPVTEDPHGTERILVVDDEEVLCRLIQGILSVHGYQVTALNSAQDAVALLREHGDDVDLVLSDVMMPEITGFQLLEEVGKIRRDLPVLLMSGYNDVAPADSSISDPSPILEKPFTSDALTRAVRRQLDLTGAQSTPQAR